MNRHMLMTVKPGFWWHLLCTTIEFHAGPLPIARFLPIAHSSGHQIFEKFLTSATQSNCIPRFCSSSYHLHYLYSSSLRHRCISHSEYKKMSSIALMFLTVALISVGSVNGLTSPTTGKATRRPSVFPNSQGVSKRDVDVLIRQTGQTNPGGAAVGIPVDSHCRHGFAQVFALDPLPCKKRMNSGLLKLTCPLLVRAVDQLEDEGFIEQFNAKLQDDSDSDESLSALRNSMKDAHKVHASVRMEMIQREEERQILQSRLGEFGSKAFLTAGVAGASSDSVSDVKCLHAWLGDYLFRGSDASPLGAMVAEVLLDRGIGLEGTPDCQRFCDPLSKLAASPPTPRNKQRLKTSKELARRRRQKESSQ